MITAPGRRLAAILAATWLVLIAYATLQPTQAVVLTPTFCIFCGPIGGVDFVLNVVIFVPLGMTIRWATGRWTIALIAGAITTLIIEVLQARLIAGRDASLGDLVANTLGTLIGAWVAMELFRWLNAGAVAARRYAAIFGIIMAAVFLASTWLLQPVRTQLWQLVRWTPQPPNSDLFQGTVFAVDLNGRPIADGVLVSPTEAYDTALHSLAVRATVSANPPLTRRPAVIVRGANYLEQGFSLSQSGTRATFRTHLVAVRLKLRAIPVGLDSAFSLSTSGTVGRVTLEAIANPRMMLVRRLPPNGELSVTLQRTVGLAWAFFMPWDLALGPRWWPANALWLGTLLLPVSFFTVRSLSAPKGNPARTIAWWPLTLVLVVLVATPITGLSGLGIGEWFGVASGIVAGMILERVTAIPRPAHLKGVAPDGTILS